jgi:hypothetical protein
MSQSPKTSAATPDVIKDAEPTSVKDGTTPAWPAKWTDYEYRPDRRDSGVTGVVCGGRARLAVVA